MFRKEEDLFLFGPKSKERVRDSAEVLRDYQELQRVERTGRSQQQEEDLKKQPIFEEKQTLGAWPAEVAQHFEEKQTFGALPADVAQHSVSFRFNSSQSLRDRIIAETSKFPVTKLTIKFSRNSFNEIPGEAIAEAFKVIPDSVTYLFLAYHGSLEQKTGQELATAFAGIPITISSLCLNFTTLDEMAATEVAIGLRGIAVQTLELAGVELGANTGNDIATILASIKVKSLHLTYNRLLYYHGLTHLIEGLRAIQPEVDTVNLCHNELDEKLSAKDKETFINLLKEISKTILIEEPIATPIKKYQRERREMISSAFFAPPPSPHHLINNDLLGIVCSYLDVIPK